jgi:hypothetical protein
MTGDVVEGRPLSEWSGRLRTVCHECRGTGHITIQDEEGMTRMTSVIVPGEGEVVRGVGTANGDDMMVSTLCPSCGDSETPGWLSGFVLPA